MRFKQGCFLFSLLCMFVLSSCNVEESIIIGEPEKVELGGLRNNVVKINMHVPIKNDKGIAFKIKEMDLVARINGKYLGTVTYDSVLVVKPHSDKVYDIELDLKVQNLLLGATALYQFSHNRKVSASLEGEIVVRYLLFNKRIEVFEQDIFKYVH